MADEWQCPQCGVHNPRSAKFCGDCGTPAPSAPSTAPANTVASQTPPPENPQVYVGRSQTVATHTAITATPTGERKYNNFGLYAVILGILALLCCGPVSGIPGIIMAKMQLDAIKNGQSPVEQRTMAFGGMWAAIIGTVVGTCGMIGALLMAIMGGMH